jgi:hypothetical protein
MKGKPNGRQQDGTEEEMVRNDKVTSAVQAHRFSLSLSHLFLLFPNSRCKRPRFGRRLAKTSPVSCFGVEKVCEARCEVRVVSCHAIGEQMNDAASVRPCSFCAHEPGFLYRRPDLRKRDKGWLSYCTSSIWLISKCVCVLVRSWIGFLDARWSLGRHLALQAAESRVVASLALLCQHSGLRGNLSVELHFLEGYVSFT